MNKLKLVYVNPIGVNSVEKKEYEFFFSETPDLVWNDDWNEENPSLCTDLLPDENTYSVIKRLVTTMDIFCVQQNSCFSISQCIDQCVCLCCETLEGLESYPEPYRLVLHFGDDYNFVVEHLKGLDMYFEDEETEE